jgi:prolyl 4-hydroxylase
MDPLELADLQGRAEAGELAAMFSLGSLAVSGGDAGIAPRRGAHMLADAALRGDAPSALLLATLYATGAFSIPNWRTALDHLAQAAELGSAYAQQQLVLLASVKADAPRGWRALRERIDIQAWLRPPAKEVLCDSPRIRKASGFLPAAACDWLVWRANARLEPAHAREAADGDVGLHEMRNNSEAAFGLLDTDLVLLITQARIAAITGVPQAVMEAPRVFQYRPGEEFAPHHDYLDPYDPSVAHDLDRNGQRIVTFLLYLNDDYDGGETDFPLARIRHRGAKGDALYFANTGAGDAPDHQTLHAGLPTTRGSKWLLSQWLRNRPPAKP